uniref:ATP-dependent DNA helicase n=2 Tax=Octopus bimaculoides TaxID=37653 RepID=A0A0L8HAK1_OCTBM
MLITRLILAKVRLQKCIAIAVATSGIAATLALVKATNRWWGVTVLLSGDFGQTLPLIPKGTRADEVMACLKSSPLWDHVVTLKLESNMRVRLNEDPSSEDFARDILLLGNGEVPEDGNEDVDISNICTIASTIQSLQAQVFPGLEVKNGDLDWLCQRAILAPKNIAVSAINNSLLLHLPGDVTVYKSVDTIPNQDEVVDYPTKVLNSLEPSGVPPHILTLKVGSPVMLIRNLNPPTLYNGTRLVITKLLPYVTEATTMTVCGKGQDIFIPQIPLVPSAADLPFTFCRV